MSPEASDFKHLSPKANRDQIDISVGQERSNIDHQISSEVKDKGQEEVSRSLRNQPDFLEADRSQTEVTRGQQRSNRGHKNPTEIK